MGYYTHYTIFIENKDDLDPETEYCVAKAIARLDEFRLGDDDDLRQINFINKIEEASDPINMALHYWDYETKWYDHEEDMMEIARQFPECIFTVYGEGEERDDIWCMYLYGDKFFKTWAKVTYEKPDWM